MVTMVNTLNLKWTLLHVISLTYRSEKGVVIFPPINFGKNQQLDLHHTAEHGRHVAACKFNCNVGDIETLGTYLWQLKKHSYVGTHPKHANFPTSYQNPTLPYGKGSGVSGANVGTGSPKKEDRQMGLTQGAARPNYSSDHAQHNQIVQSVK